jgi:hypothetical protein
MGPQIIHKKGVMVVPLSELLLVNLLGELEEL